ncbi:hypothetical protein MATL_G00061660 [Megalops atlanticus]|uniref:PP1-binding domain-containing protein n=1 Tax=Megalops atlanticus TaxID=7932 RepID=A0A9D3Q710_MEGAT|nr:hypothetical protein MATL_G00061660 [Megalops atlanticus]
MWHCAAVPSVVSRSTQLGHSNCANPSFIVTYFKDVEMASTEMKIDTTEFGPTLSTDISALPSLTPPTTPQNNNLDFSQVTPAQLGITTQSFISSCQHKDKSRLSQLKGKRRSTIGVRGSPETNSLIRFIAQNRQEASTGTPQSLQASPFFRRPCMLKEKMASFQSLVEVKENQTLECQKETCENSAYLSVNGSTPAGGKENSDPDSCPRSIAPPSSKRPRCLGQNTQTVFSACCASFVRGSAQMEVTQLEPQTPSGPELTSCKAEKSMFLSPLQPPVPQRILNHDPLPFSLAHCTPTKEQQTCSSEPQSPSVLLLFDPEDIRSTQPVPFPSVSPLPTQPAAAGEAEPAGNSVLCKKKRVHFGVPLSPEFFDKRLPPSTPLQKGGTPAHLPSSAGSQLRSVLKTPQRSMAPLPQPNFNSPSVTGASPPLSLGSCAAGAQMAHAEDEEKVTPTIVAKEARRSREVTDVASPVCAKDIAQCESQPPDMTPVVPQSPSRETETAGANMEPAPAPISEQPVSVAPLARSRSRKRKLPDENSAVRKRTSRSAAISASGKMKDSAGKRRWGSKEVDRSLYGKRDYASKNPTLSPITEALSSTSRSPTPQRHRAARSFPAEAPSIPWGETGHGDPAANVATAAAMWRRRFCLPAWERELKSDHTNEIEEASDDCPSGSPASPKDITSENVVISAGSTSDCMASGVLGLQPPVFEEKVKERAGRVSRPRGRSRGKGKKDKVPCADSFETEDKIGDDSSKWTDREDETDIKAESSSRSHTSPTDLPVNGPKTDADCSSAHTHGAGAPERGPLIDSDTSREGDGHTNEDADTRCDIPCEADSRATLDCDTTRSFQSDRDQAFSRSEDKPNEGRRGRAVGRPRGRRSSLLRPQFTVEEGAVQGAQEDIVAASLERQENCELSARIIEKEEVVGEGEGAEGREAVADRDGKLPIQPSQSGTERLDALLPPWQQADFLIEDVLQPLPKGRASVRRSLRNKSQQDPTGAGLVWVPRTSPALRRSTGGPRRRTRGCPRGRSSTAHDTLAIPEEVPL